MLPAACFDCQSRSENLNRNFSKDTNQSSLVNLNNDQRLRSDLKVNRDSSC